MSGVVLIQGGDEFADDCRAMDTALLDSVDRGPIGILPLASESDRAAELTTAHAIDYYRALGATEVLAIPTETSQALLALSDVQVVVLPGGSPRLLLERLTADQGRMADALRAVLLAGGAISGSSAGAMVLGAATWLPDEDQVVPGLGLLPSSQPLLVLPHSDGTPTRWLTLAERGHAAVPGIRGLALGEHSGRLYRDGQEEAFGNIYFWE